MTIDTDKRELTLGELAFAARMQMTVSRIAIADDDPDKFKKAVHLTSIHMEKGFQCVDCHFAQDSHGNGHIYGEVAAAIEIDCADCHGTATRYPTLFTSGPASQPSGTDMSLLRTQDGRKRFEWREGKLYQRAALDPDKQAAFTRDLLALLEAGNRSRDRSLVLPSEYLEVVVEKT